ncbi:hypothetical protein Tco_0071251 [Tanacetum coccineum]
MNAITLRSTIENEKLNESNFLNWYINLRITFKYEGNLHNMDSPLPNHHATPEQIIAYQALFAGEEKVALLMLACMTPDLQKEMDNCTAFDMTNELKNMFQIQASQELHDTQMRLNTCKMDGGQSVSCFEDEELNP